MWFPQGLTTLSQFDDVIFVLKIWVVSEKVIASRALPKRALNSPDSLDSELTLWNISGKRWFALGFNRGCDWIKNMTAGSTVIFFAQLQLFWWTFANTYRKNYCFEVSFRKFFFQTSIPPLISIFYPKEYHDFPSKNFRLTVLKSSYRNPSVFHKISGIEKFYR